MVCQARPNMGRIVRVRAQTNRQIDTVPVTAVHDPATMLLLGSGWEGLNLTAGSSGAGTSTEAVMGSERQDRTEGQKIP
jgi:hypothetical protein